MNFILLIVDCLRRDHVGLYDQEGESLTPNIDELFGQGTVRFERCFSNGPQTPPSMTSFLTSSHPLAHGGHRFVGKGRTTLAEVMAGLGYQTGAFHSNPTMCRERFFDRGFDHYEDDVMPGVLRGLRNFHLSDSTSIRATRFFRFFRCAPSLPAEVVNGRAMQWLSGVPGDFLVWIHYMDVHGPYLDRKAWIPWVERYRSRRLFHRALADPSTVSERERQRLVSLYREDVKYVDRAIGEFVRWVDSSGRGEDACIILSADHGEEFAEHGQYDHSNRPYNELVRVPLLVRLPSRREAVRDDVVSLIDISSTIISMAGVPLERVPRTWQGSPCFMSEGQADRTGNRPVFIEREEPGGNRYAIVSWPWKYIMDEVLHTEELYDIESDQDERVDVSSKEDEVLLTMQNLMTDHIEANRASASEADPTTVEVTPEVRQRLQELGYFDV